MAKPVVIIVEGLADRKFLTDYISHLKIEPFDNENIIDAKGWETIVSEGAQGELIRTQMEKNFNGNGGINLIIFDADLDKKKREQEILEWKKKFNLSFELFLLPDNSNSGTLEHLLEKIIQDNNNPIFDCWDQYEKCLKTKTIIGRSEPLTIPTKKTKIYGYLEALLGSTKSEKNKIKEDKRNYKENKHWNLDSEHLSSLKNFLINNIK